MVHQLCLNKNRNVSRLSTACLAILVLLTTQTEAQNVTTPVAKSPAAAQQQTPKKSTGMLAPLLPIEAEGKSETSNSKPQPKSFDEKATVRAIYELTKTTKSAKELTTFIEKCDDAMAKGLSQKNSKYITSLTGWALNLRGQKRMELALQLKSIGNSQHESATQQAMDDFDRAVVCDSERYRTWMGRGIAYVSLKEYRKAAIDFTNVLKLKTDLPAGWFNRAESLYHLGRYEEALDDYNAALQLNSDDAEALTGRGHSQFALGKINLALADYQAVAKLLPENPTALINVGDAHQALGNWKEALASYDQSLSKKQTGTGYQRLSWLKATCPESSFKDSGQAIEFAKRAIKMTGDSALNLDTLAAAEASAGNFEEAKTTQQKVIGLVTAETEIESQDDASAKSESPYQVRMALYQKGEPFTQPESAEPEPESNSNQK